MRIKYRYVEQQLLRKQPEIITPERTNTRSLFFDKKSVMYLLYLDKFLVPSSIIMAVTVNQGVEE
jgi:hypothetical protein